MNKLLFFLMLSLSACSTSPQKNKQIVYARITAYCRQESDHIKYKNLAANGSELKVGVHLASDWSVFPVDTLIKINDRVYQISDYGSALVDKPIPVIDLYVENKKQMYNWGVKYQEVEIIQMGDYEKSARILKNRLRFSHCKLMFDRIQEKL